MNHQALVKLALLWLLPALASAQTFRGAGTFVNSGGSLTPGLPTGHTAGDVNILLTGVTGAVVDLDLSGSGWTLLVQTFETPRYLQSWCRLEQGGDAAPSYDWDGANRSFAQILGFHNMGFTDCSTILDVFAHSTSDSASWPSPGVVPTQANEIVVAFGLKQQDGTPLDPGDISCPTGGSFTEDSEYSINASFDPHWMACHLIQAAATEVTASEFTASGSLESVLDGTFRQTIAIKGGAIGGFSHVRGPTHLPGRVQ